MLAIGEQVMGSQIKGGGVEGCSLGGQEPLQVLIYQDKALLDVLY